MTQIVLALEHLVEPGYVLVRADNAWYAVDVRPFFDEPTAGLGWWRIRRMEAFDRTPLPIPEDLAGSRLKPIGAYLAVKLPEHHARQLGYAMGYLVTDRTAERVDRAPIPKPPGRLPVEWRSGRWERIGARGRRERYTADGWVLF